MFIETALADNDTITIQDTTNEQMAPEAIESSSTWTSMVPMVLVFAVFYFLLIRPQEKKRRAQEDLVSGVKKGEEVLTNSGLFGTVIKINDSDNTIIVQIAKDIEVKMLKNSIADIVSRDKKNGKTLPATKTSSKKQTKKSLKETSAATKAKKSPTKVKK